MNSTSGSPSSVKNFTTSRWSNWSNHSFMIPPWLLFHRLLSITTSSTVSDQMGASIGRVNGPGGRGRAIISFCSSIVTVLHRHIRSSPKDRWVEEPDGRRSTAVSGSERAAFVLRASWHSPIGAVLGSGGFGWLCRGVRRSGRCGRIRGETASRHLLAAPHSR